MVARSVRFACTHREDVQAIVNGGLVNAMPSMQQTLLQFTTLIYIKSSAIYKEYLTRTRN